jgi:hypothetical protein
MKARYTAIFAATVIALGTGPVIADHNSKNGEGTANMPNDIHNTRIDTMEADDNEAFRDFVRYGEGSESVNRFDSDDTTARRNKAREGNAQAQQAQTSSKQRLRTNDRKMEQKRTRTDRASSSSARERSATQRENAPRGERQRQNRNRSSGRRS